MSLLLPLSISLAHAETSQNHFANIKNGLSKLIAPEPTRSAHSVDITSLSRYSLDTSQVAELPRLPGHNRDSLLPALSWLLFHKR